MAITYNSENRTSHAWNDHPERMQLIEEYLGFTNIVVEIVELRADGRYSRKGLTSSGVIVVRSLYEDRMITAFMANEYQAVDICLRAGKKCVPPKLLNKIRKNNKRHPEINLA